MLWFSTNYMLLIKAFIIRGLKEFGEPTRKSLIMDLSPAGQRPVYFAVIYFYRDVMVTMSALIGTYLWKNMNPAYTFITFAFFGLLGTAIFAVKGEDSPVTKYL